MPSAGTFGPNMPSPVPGAPATPEAQPVGNAPAAAGPLTPQEPTGEIEAAKLDVFHAVKLLDRALSKFGNNEDGTVALKARAMLTKRFGQFEDESEEFSPAEMKRMLASLAGPGATGPPPQQGGGAPPPPGPPPQ
jgi:hypothetical protein